MYALFVKIKFAGAELSMAYDIYETFAEAMVSFEKRCKSNSGEVRTVSIAQRGPDGKFNKGPYGFNVVYQVTIKE